LLCDGYIESILVRTGMLILWEYGMI